MGQPVFLTWRLHGSLPPQRFFSAGEMSSGQAFAALDRLLEETRSGPLYLRQPAIAEMVVDAIRYNAEVLGHYVPHAFVVMPYIPSQAVSTGYAWIPSVAHPTNVKP